VLGHYNAPPKNYTGNEVTGVNFYKSRMGVVLRSNRRVACNALRCPKSNTIQWRVDKMHILGLHNRKANELFTLYKGYG